MKQQILICLVLLITGTCYGQFDKIKLGVTGSFDLIVTCHIKQVHLNKFMNNPVHIGLELQIWHK